MIEYNRHMRTFHLRKDGTSSKEKEFVKAVVSLREFWADVKGFIAEFILCRITSCRRHRAGNLLR